MNRTPDLTQNLNQFFEQLETSLQRLETILRHAPLTALDAREALLFNLERAAWSAIELANFWVFQLRLGVPRKDTESFDILAKEGLLPLDAARRLRYATEYRNLSRRNAGLLDWEHLEKNISLDIAVLREWSATVARR